MRDALLAHAGEALNSRFSFQALTTDQQNDVIEFLKSLQILPAGTKCFVSCTSSDALLMNIFCHPGVKRDGRLAALLGGEPGTSPCFGYKAHVALANCGVHLSLGAECTKHCCTGEMDPDRNLAIGARLKTIPELFQIYLGSIHRACQEIEVSGQLFSHLNLLLQFDRAVTEQHCLA